MTDALRAGELSLNSLLSQGLHLRTDLIVIYHGFPPKVPALSSLRDNIKNVLLTRTDFVPDIVEKTAWLSPADKQNPIRVREHAQSFISTKNRIQGLIKRSLAGEERPISEYFVPFKGSLINPQNDLMEGLVGKEGDTIHIINRDTQLWKDIKYEATILQRQGQQIRQRQVELENEMMLAFASNPPAGGRLLNMQTLADALPSTPPTPVHLAHTATLQAGSTTPPTTPEAGTTSEEDELTQSTESWETESCECGKDLAACGACGEGWSQGKRYARAVARSYKVEEEMRNARSIDRDEEADTSEEDDSTANSSEEEEEEEGMSDEAFELTLKSLQV